MISHKVCIEQNRNIKNSAYFDLSAKKNSRFYLFKEKNKH
jgi:hypothetical protein